MSDSSTHLNQRRVLRFVGHVQGVGFRYTTQQIARDFAVRGYVRNLPNGDVEVIVEGAAHEIDAFVKSIQQRMGQFIRETRQDTQPASGEFADFSVRG